jgi:hypothetical protein
MKSRFQGPSQHQHPTVLQFVIETVSVGRPENHEDEEQKPEI